MTERIYFEDAYCETFEAEVTDADGNEVVLDRTAFYPTGGGQPNDTGWLRSSDGEVAVTDVHGRGEITHVTSEELDLERGTPVVGVLDWERRYALMRYHTAQHLLSAVLLDAFDAPTVGNQLYPDRARIDVAHDRFYESDLEALEGHVNDLIAAAHPVTTFQLSREKAEARLDPERTRLDLLPESVDPVRIVQIGPEDDPLDRTACGGTHVHGTEELPPMEITGRETKGPDEERIRFHLPGADQPPG